MKTRLITLVANTLIGLIGTSAVAQIGIDTYIGGEAAYTSFEVEAVPYQVDVIGDESVFDLTGYEVIQHIGADTLEVIIHGNYFDNILSGEFLQTTQMGDLFISTTGLVDDDTYEATLTDYYLSAAGYTEWDYGVQLGTYLSTPDNNLGGKRLMNGDLHQISGNDITLSYLNKPFSAFRDNQEVLLKTDYDAASEDAQWYIDTIRDNNFLSITINNFTSLFGTYETLGFHWTMSCGNDVLEFEWTNTNPVPEPQAIAFFGVFGMGILLLIRRRLLK